MTTARPKAPFGDVVVALLAAAGYAALALGDVATGWLPGGRWHAVHLFTLGVLTNVILAFTHHFARTLTKVPGETPRWWLPVANIGIALSLIGRTVGPRWTIGVGATIVTVVVVQSYRGLRDMRQAALGARFSWIVRMYERAHGAFIHGATLGLLLGVGLLRGSWYGTGRLAHLHVNLLGWGGLTLLATVVFFGPTMLRTRIVPGADERAARVLRYGASGLTLGVIALLLSAFDGWVGVSLRVLAAVYVAVFAASVTLICVDVLRATSTARRGASRGLVKAAATWFPIVAWLDVGVIGAGAWQHLDALGVLLILGVLLQSMLATVVYVAPLLRRRTPRRTRDRERLERGATPRALAYNLGVLHVAVAHTSFGRELDGMALVGWVLVGIAAAWVVVASIGWPSAAIASDGAAPDD